MLRTRSLAKCHALIFLSIVISCVTPLPTPKNISIETVNMRHFLKWSPLEAECDTVYYSVMFQGEYEIHMLNGSWVEALNCQKIVETKCDLTLDLSSDSDYSISVQALCDGRTSWGRLPTTFNRKDTLLVPNMTLTLMRSYIKVDFSEKLPYTSINLSLWKEGHEHSVIREETKTPPPFLLKTPNGGRHCLKADVFVGYINKTNSTTKCIFIPSRLVHWAVVFTVCTVVAVIVVVSVVLGWKAPQCIACLKPLCHKEVLPNVLLEDWPTATPNVFTELLPEPTHSVLVLHPLQVQDRTSEMKATRTANISAEAMLGS
ncbi:interleukin-20 receptor subunit beta [Brachyhypopomus gauderio]|uniref:interleukin-20 receptor subunit beta n=1 Tax=Brachyhypopomus gauderio TaxID=698409 RepID=UPI0040427FA4